MNHRLSAAEIEELATAAEKETEQQPSTYPALSLEDVPSVASFEDRQLLVSVTNVRSVNALRPDQTLSFGPQLTVIYGDNGSGKSGYARVLKKVYRARVVEEILGNVLSEEPSAEPWAATFTLREPGGADSVVEWRDETAAVAVGRFAVLDTACAGAYIRGGALAAGPPGIEIPRRFTEDLDRVKNELLRRKRAATPTKSALQRLENDTDAGRFIRTLSASTADAVVDKFATWTNQDARELEDTEHAIAEARAHTPSARRSQLEAKLRALESIRTRIFRCLDAVKDEAIEDAKSTAHTLAEAEAALRAAKAFDDPTIRPELVKGQPWLQLLEAAAAYVQSLQGVAASTGSLSVEGRCALCWQHIDDTAARRVARFQEHLEGAAVRSHDAAANAVATVVERIKAIPQSLTPEDEAVLESDRAVLRDVRSLMSMLNARREALLSFLTARLPLETLGPLVTDAMVALEQLHRATADAMTTLPADDAEGRQQLSALEWKALELRTRRGVAESIDTVRAFISNTREHQRLAQAETGINSRAASLKASELHKKHMTARYSELVNDELRELRFRRKRPTLSQATNKGTVEVTPLVSAELSHISAERVFSEGERTAIALACFLAELRLGSDASGLIFDDPVSSLDHHVREHVARRLVAAAKERQVIVFTHDLAFLADLREQAKKIQGVECAFRTLTATDYEAGFVENEEPFGARSVGKRIKALKPLLVEIERHAKAGDMAAFRLKSKDFYEKLRSTWERFVEERLFAEVVQRLERNVIVGALSRVTYTPDLGERVHEGWRRCSRVLEAHDHAPAAGSTSYSVEEMKADLQLLQDVESGTPKKN